MLTQIMYTYTSYIPIHVTVYSIKVSHKSNTIIITIDIRIYIILGITSNVVMHTLLVQPFLHIGYRTVIKKQNKQNFFICYIHKKSGRSTLKTFPLKI